MLLLQEFYFSILNYREQSLKDIFVIQGFLNFK